MNVFTQACLAALMVVPLLSGAAPVSEIQAGATVDVLWIGEVREALGVRLQEGARIFRQEAHHLDDIAADNDREAVWTAGKKEVVKYSWNGSELARHVLPVSPVRRGSGKQAAGHDKSVRPGDRHDDDQGEGSTAAERTQISLDPADGSLWVGAGHWLLKLSSDGRLLFKARVSSPLVDVSVNIADRSCWAAQKDRITQYSSDGEVLLIADIEKGVPISSLAADPLDAGLWIGTKKGFIKLDEQGNELFRRAGPHDIQDLKLDLSTGTLWLITKKEVFLFGRQGDEVLRRAFCRKDREEDHRSFHKAAGLQHYRGHDQACGEDEDEDGKGLERKQKCRGNLAALAVDPASGGCFIAWRKTVVLLDRAGNARRWLKDFEQIAALDVGMPKLTITIASPENGATMDADAITVSGTVSDTGAKVTVNGRETVVAGRAFEAREVPLAIGENTVTAVAKNAAGLTSAASITITRRSALPELAVRISSPRAGDVLTVSRVTVTGTTSDSAATVVVNGIPAAVSGTTFTASDIPLVIGQNAITASAFDQHGRSAADSLSVTVTWIAVAITSPEPGQEVLEATTTVTGMVSDPTALVEVNGREATVSGDGTFSIAGILLKEGWSDIAVQAVNRAGQTAEARVQVNRMPVGAVSPFVHVLATSGGTFISTPTFTVFGRVSDPSFQVIVNDVPAAIDGNLFSAEVYVCEGQEFEYGEGRGSCQITVSAYTSDGEQVTQVRFYSHGRREDPLQVAITNLPRSSTTPEPQVEVRGTVKSALADLDAPHVRVNGVQAELAGDAFRAVVPLVDGANYVVVKADNFLREEAYDVVEIIYEDPGKPLRIAVSSPADGAIVNHPEVPVTGFMSDSTAAVTINGAPADQDRWSYRLPIVALSEGQNVISVIATRPNGEATAAAVTVTYDPTYPAPPAPHLAALTEYTRGTSVEVSGSSRPGLNVELFLNGAPVWGQIKYDSDGRFIGRIGLDEGPNQIAARTADTYGNRSAFSNTAAIVRDTMRPRITAELVIQSLNLGLSRVTLIGGTEPHADLDIMIDSEPGYRYHVKADASGGFRQDLVMSAGKHYIAISATDLAGNRGSYGRVHTVYAPGTSVTMRPRLDPLPSPVDADAITVEGNAYARFAVELYRNGELVGEGVADSRGRFRFENVSLVQGTNILKVRQKEAQVDLGPQYFFLKASESTERSVEQTAGAPARPVVKIDFPQDGSVTNAAHLPLRGSIDRPDIWMTASGSYYSEVTGAWTENGRFVGFETIPLLPGPNTLWVEALAPDGSRGVDKITVAYQPDAAAPAVILTAPLDRGEVYDQMIDVVGTSGPIRTIVVNEAEAVVSDGVFTATIDILGIGYTHRPDQGREFITAWAMDDGGRIGHNEVQVGYRYMPVPTITIDTPANQQILDTPAAVLSGTAYDAVELTVNNRPVLLTRGSFNAPVELQEGRNRFNIIAKNGPKASAANVVVYYYPASQVSLQSVVLSPDPLHIALGRGKQITAVGTYTNGQTADLARTCAWTSSDEWVATVHKGYVQSQHWGRAAITAQCGPFTNEIRVAVNEAVIEEIQVAYEQVLPDGKTIYAFGSPQVNPGDKVNFRAIGTYANGKIEDVTASAQWSSSNPAVIAPDSRGQATAIGLGTATITATFGDVSGSNQVTVAPPKITLVVTSPQDYWTTDKDRITVSGMVFSKASEVGVRVNGKPAMVSGNQFTANRVPVPEGSSVVRIEATDTNGSTGESRVIVTRTASGNPLRLAASIESGIGPLETVIRIDGVPMDAVPDIKTSGPGPVEFLDCSSTDSCKIRMTAVGVYTVTVTSVGYDGNIYSDSIDITVLDRVKLDALLQAKWAGMKDALAKGDVEGAVGYFTTRSQDRYRGIFIALAQDMENLVNNMQSIQLVYVNDSIAKYRIRKSEIYGGQLMIITYYIYYVRNMEGNWFIDQF